LAAPDADPGDWTISPICLPAAGAQWRSNLYRCDRAANAFLAWSRTLSQAFHTPGKFGISEFGR